MQARAAEANQLWASQRNVSVPDWLSPHNISIEQRCKTAVRPNKDYFVLYFWKMDRFLSDEWGLFDIQDMVIWRSANSFFCTVRYKFGCCSAAADVVIVLSSLFIIMTVREIFDNQISIQECHAFTNMCSTQQNVYPSVCESEPLCNLTFKWRTKTLILERCKKSLTAPLWLRNFSFNFSFFIKFIERPWGKATPNSLVISCCANDSKFINVEQHICFSIFEYAIFCPTCKLIS